MSNFVDYLNVYGSSDGRYALEGIFINGPVIHPLDSLSVLVRSLIRRRNDQLFRQSVAESTREFKFDRDWMISAQLPLERLFAELYNVGECQKLRWTFRNMNFAFFDERTEAASAQKESTFGGQINALSPLTNHLVRLPQLDDSEHNIRVTNVAESLVFWSAKKAETRPP
jgi:hypothetical protein